MDNREVVVEGMEGQCHRVAGDEVEQGRGDRVHDGVELFPAVDLLDLRAPNEVEIEHGEITAIAREGPQGLARVEHGG